MRRLCSPILRLRHLLTTRHIFLPIVLLALCVAMLSWGTGWMPGQSRAKAAAKSTVPGNYDIRVNGQDHKENLAKVMAGHFAAMSTLPANRALMAARAKAIEQGLVKLRKVAPSAEIQFSRTTGGVEMVSSLTALSAPAQGSGRDLVTAYLHANKSIYGLTDDEIEGLHFIGESLSPSGLRMVRMEQVVNGQPVFQSETRFILDREGRLIRSLGSLVPQAAAPPLSGLLPAADALASALSFVQITVDPSNMTLTNTNVAGTKTEVVPNDPQIAGNVQSYVVYFPAAPGVLIPAWLQVAFTKGSADWYTVTDANTGALLWRKNIRSYASTQQARFSVYVQADGTTPADSPAPHSPTNVTPGSGTQFPEISRTIVSMLTAQDLTASPDGWIPDGGSTTTGNNVDAYLDRVQGGGAGGANQPDTGALDNNGRPIGNPDAFSNNRDFLGAAPRDFTYNPAPFGGNPDAGDSPFLAPYQRGVVTHLFYLANWYHDKLYKLGFNEAAGNFQNTNFSGMGVGGDRVLAEAQDGSGTNNANFSTPPDGMSGRMQMYIFNFPTPDRDGSLDAEVVLHELTHGVSNRLIGNGNGLIWDPGSGMGEGWSDFYALSLLNNTNADDPNGSYAEGGYATYKLGGLTDNYLYGIRRFPYSTNHSINPLTWADVDDVTYNEAGGIAASPLGFAGNGAFEVHNIGEIWALTLWGVRSRIIADPAGANGDVPTGNQKMLQIVTDALKMTPLNPSFTDGRDAIIAADCATNACANEQSIWAGFADRGLGYKAVAPLGQAGILGVGGHEGIGESFASPYLDVQSVTIDDSLGNNNGAIDPGEPIKITVKLTNPWRNTAMGVASATATLATSTAGVTIVDGNSTYPAIPAQGSANGDTFLFAVPTSATCGQSLKFTITPNSSLGMTPVNFVLRVGQAAGVGPALTYTRTIAGGLAIPDSNFRGVTDTFTITDDFEIADLDFRVDSLTHTFTGDLTVELKAPNGYGTDLIYQRGLFIGDGDGDNFTNTVIDGQAMNDLNLSGHAAAPYTGSWLPAFNSPIWNLFGIPNLGPDPVDQLGRLNGLSTQGDWKVHVTDEANLDTGKLNSWSLIVTPKAFTCMAFTPTASVSGTKTVAGTFTPGGTVTYTVTLTNNGTGTQGDNAGHEFTDVLPAQLTLVSAMATSGTAATSMNTVTWDGSLPLLGGSVTITITATIKAGVVGPVSNQGSISFDNNNDNINNAAAVTDDPGVGGSTDPTVFNVLGTPGVTAKIQDPAACTGPGGIVSVTAQVTNPNATTQAATFTATLPAQLPVVAGTCSADVAGAFTSCSGTSVIWNGSLAAGQTVTITYQAQIADGTPQGTLLCITSTGTVAGVPATVQACTTVNCPTVGPGTPPSAGVPVSDQKPGSVLFYNLYTSNPANLNAQNTRLNITNTDPSRAAVVHLFFVDGATCTPADSYICLTPNQTLSFTAGDVDPGTTGYLIAVASDSTTGCPVNFNFLIGDEFVKLSSGHQANLGAEAFAALTGTPPVCSAGTATLNFNGMSYNQAPRVLAVDNFPSPADGNNTLVILNRVGGDLASGASNLGALFGVLYDEAEQPLSFSLSSNTCQFRFQLANSALRTAQRLETVISAGRTGWLRLWGVGDIGLLGSVINLNATAGVNNFSQGHNLHKLTFTNASLTIPIIPPAC